VVGRADAGAEDGAARCASWRQRPPRAEPAALDADHAAIEQVLTKEHLALTALEPGQVERLTGELDPAGRHGRDAVAGDEQLAPGDARPQSGDGRVPALRQANDHIVDPAEALPGPVDEPAAREFGEPEPCRRRIAFARRSGGRGAGL
jgi:hypothetical protein